MNSLPLKTKSDLNQQINKQVNKIAYLTLLQHRFNSINQLQNGYISNSRDSSSNASTRENENGKANIVVENDLMKKSNLKQAIEELDLKIKDSMQSIKPEQWTYSILKDSQPLMKAILLMANTLITTYQQFLERSDHSKKIEWCLFIDNSDSIKSSNKTNLVIQYVVVLCEMLRRLETKFSVAKFGDPKDGFSLLKSFQTPMSLTVGERIIESLTFDQGSLIENCMANICEKIWPHSNNTTENTLHVAVFITDGLFVEPQAELFNKTVRDFNLNLGFLFVSEPLKAFKQLIHNFPQFEISVNNFQHAFELIEQLLKKVTWDINSGTCEKFLRVKCYSPSDSEKDYVLLDGFIQENLDLNKTIEQSSQKLLESSKNLFSVYCSNKLVETSNEVGTDNENRKLKLILPDNSLSDMITKIKEYYEQLEKQHSVDIEKCNKSWLESELILNKDISDYEEVLQDVVLPNNRYTRKKGDSKGSSLYIPGLIKAVISDFSYNKIFASKTSGGCRNYSIYFCVDISYSLHGQMQEFIIQALFSFISALVRMGIENFTIIVFAESVKIVKLESQAWDKTAVFTLLKSLAEKNQYATADAAALQTALDLCELSPGSGPKKIFIFTDGFSSYPSCLRTVINEIEMKGIELLAIAIGNEKFNLHQYYKRYITACLPSFVHKALRAIYEIDDGLNVQTDESDQLNKLFKEASLKGRTDIDDILNNRRRVFENLRDEMNSHERLALREKSINSQQICKLSNTNSRCDCLDCRNTFTFKHSAKLEIFKTRLAREGGQLGKLQITLVWNNFNDLDLHCIDPNGEEIYYSHKKALSGGMLDVDMNVVNLVRDPVENIVWKNDPPKGTYRVFVKYYSKHDAILFSDYELLIAMENRTPLIFPGQMSNVGEKRLIHEFQI